MFVLAAVPILAAVAPALATWRSRHGECPPWAIDASPADLLVALTVRGLFGVMIALPVASLTWKAWAIHTLPRAFRPTT
jgi:hypothetical protein